MCGQSLPISFAQPVSAQQGAQVDEVDEELDEDDEDNYLADELDDDEDFDDEDDADVDEEEEYVSHPVGCGCGGFKF